MAEEADVTPVPITDIAAISLTDSTAKQRRRAEVKISEEDAGRPCVNCTKDKCPGFSPHEWRKECSHCMCARELHDIYNEDFVNVYDRIGWEKPDDPLLAVDKNSTLNMGYTWVPSGISKAKVEEYMDQLDNNKPPRIGSRGEKIRDLQLIIQLPKQDMAESYCKNLNTAGQKRAFAEYLHERDEEIMDIGRIIEEVGEDFNCHGCESYIERGDMAVCAPNQEGKWWHPACFTCSCCEELLVDLVYCFMDGQLFCERHYAEKVKPRCGACDELIFSSEYTKAMDQDWHTGHFACWNCNMSLTGHRYILRDEHPFCINCYENLFANSCEDCKTPIGTDSKDLSYKDKHWHEKCFKCCDCKNSLVDQPFASKDEHLYCADCHDNNFAARCDGCTNIFRAGMKKFEFRGKQWHEECFSCSVCKQPIGNKRFIPRDQEFVCVPCYEEQFAQRCAKCSGVINKGGITYKSTPFHRDCFMCTNCQKVLAGEKFTSREDQPYCADCFGDLFAKKCCRCTKPITGLGGTKFISFDDRHWHSDCFGCYKCSISLVGRGFLTNGGDVLCPDCGKNM